MNSTRSDETSTQIQYLWYKLIYPIICHFASTFGSGLVCQVYPGFRGTQTHDVLFTHFHLHKGIQSLEIRVYTWQTTPDPNFLLVNSINTFGHVDSTRDRPLFPNATLYAPHATHTQTDCLCTLSKNIFYKNNIFPFL